LTGSFVKFALTTATTIKNTMNPMDDPLLARARLLVQATAGLPDFHSLSATINPNSPIENPSTTSPYSSPARGPAPAGSFFTSFKCSVIKGSSLVSVMFPSGGDIRNHVKRGMDVEIDGVQYKLSEKKGAEWSSTKVELTQDYTGESNMDATFGVYEKSRRSPKKKNVPEPIASADIRDAISGLDTISTMLGRPDRHEEAYNKPVRQMNAAKNMNIVSKKKPMSEFQAVPVEQRQVEEDAVPSPPKRIKPSEKSSYSGRDESNEGNYPTLHSLSGLEHGSVGGGGGGYLNQARHISVEVQRKKAMERALRKMKEDDIESAKRLRQEEEKKNVHKQAMEIKTAQLREKTLARVTKLKHDRLEKDENEKATKMAELNKKLAGEALIQADVYKEKMRKMKADTARRMRARRQAEEDRALIEKKLMNKKLNEISDSRRRIDRAIPEGYVPPKHTQYVVRQTRTASPRNGKQRTQSPVVEMSYDDGRLAPPPFARSSSPVVIESAQQPKNNMVEEYHQPQNALHYQQQQHVSPPAKRSGIPIPTLYNKAKPSTEEDEWSDDSLGEAPPQSTAEEFAPANYETLSPPNHRNYDEDVSVLTFDSPQRNKGRKPSFRGGENSSASSGLVLATKKTKKVWRSLKPLTISEYAAVPKDIER